MRGLKLSSFSNFQCHLTVALSRVRGLKLLLLASGKYSFGRTLTSAWIETRSSLQSTKVNPVALSRVRGLKLWSSCQKPACQSRTLTSAWIETVKDSDMYSGYVVALSRVRGLKLLTISLLQR